MILTQAAVYAWEAGLFVQITVIVDDIGGFGGSVKEEVAFGGVDPGRDLGTRGDAAGDAVLKEGGYL